MQRINRRNRKVTTFHTGTVTDVAAFIFCTGVPGAFFRINMVRTTMHIDFEPDVIKHKKFGFRAEKRGIGNSTGDQVGFGTLGQ